MCRAPAHKPLREPIRKSEWGCAQVTGLLLPGQVSAPDAESFQASEHGHGHLAWIEELLRKLLHFFGGHTLDALQHFVQREEALEIQLLPREVTHAARSRFQPQ